MRIGLVIYGALETQSGGYLYDRRLVAHLRAAGDAVEILSLPWRNYPAHLGDSLSRAWAKRLRAARYDVLLEDELNHPSLLRASGLVPRGTRRVSIIHHLRCSERRPAWQNGLYRAIETRYLRGVGSFIFNSQTTRASVEALVGPADHAVVAVPAGDRWSNLPTERDIAARALTPGPLRVVAVGNVIARKGFHALIDGLALLPREGWRLRICGRLDAEPGYAQSLRAQVERLGLGGQIALAGGLDDAALAEALSNSDVLAVPSSYEGYGIVYVEGMGFGLPALASAAGAAGEIVTPGRDGWLVPPEDPGAIAAALGPVLADRDRLRAMSLAARQRFDTHPTWDQSMARIRKFLASDQVGSSNEPIRWAAL
jgi:glycosyltransferase involved in cell wall biosynthesis